MLSIISGLMVQKVEAEAAHQLSDFVDKGGTLTLEQLGCLKDKTKSVYHGKIIEAGDHVCREIKDIQTKAKIIDDDLVDEQAAI